MCNKAPLVTERVFTDKKYRFFTSSVRVETCSASARAHSPAFFIEEKSTSQRSRGRISGATYANVPERTASVLDSGQLIRWDAWQRYRFRKIDACGDLSVPGIEFRYNVSSIISPINKTVSNLRDRYFPYVTVSDLQNINIIFITYFPRNNLSNITTVL